MLIIPILSSQLHTHYILVTSYNYIQLHTHYILYSSLSASQYFKSIELLYFIVNGNDFLMFASNFNDS